MNPALTAGAETLVLRVAESSSLDINHSSVFPLSTPCVVDEGQNDDVFIAL